MLVLGALGPDWEWQSHTGSSAARTGRPLGAMLGTYWCVLVPYQFLLVHTGLVAAPHQQHGAQPLRQHLQELHICLVLRKTPKPPLFAPFSLFLSFSPLSHPLFPFIFLFPPYPTPFLRRSPSHPFFPLFLPHFPHSPVAMAALSITRHHSYAPPLFP